MWKLGAYDMVLVPTQGKEFLHVSNLSDIIDFLTELQWCMTMSMLIHLGHYAT